MVRGRAAAAVVVVLLADAMVHLYWATGATWPAREARGLSIAVLDMEVPFTAPVLLTLVVLLCGAAACVWARSRQVPGEPPGLWGRVTAAGTLAVALGLLVRGAVGVVWACGVGVDTGKPFYWLNLLLYTPLCLGLGVAALAVAGHGRRRTWPHRTAVAGSLILTTLALYGAYGYLPTPRDDYRPGAASRYVETSLARFHYVREGTGSPVVLLSPGSSWLFAWRPQVAALAASHTVYAVDLPGQGFTKLHDRAFHWDLDGMTTAIGSFLDAVGLPVVALGGNSWSGGWALAYAQRYPQRVTRLVLLAPSGLAVPDTPVWEAVKAPVVGELVTKLLFADRSVVASAVRGLFGHPERVSDELVEAMYAPNTLPDNLRATYLLERGLDWRQTQAALGRTRQPTLILWGTRDTTLPVGQAAVFGRLMPDARVHLLDGCGHALTLDCPEQVDPLIEDFLHAP